MAYAIIPRYRGTDTLASWRDADRFAGEFFGWSRVGRSQLVGETRRAFVPQIDVSCSDETYSVTAELPGLTQEDFEVEVEDGVLTLKGEKKSQHEEAESGPRRIETRSGRFERRLRFSAPIDEEKVSAQYADGVLRVEVPRREPAHPEVRSVPIETA